ncbi:MAG TPA: acyl-CoA dehydrogenase family protein [Pirellulaceae bacterium]|nr:acyl-CoA dehydrogenase family protein [Pirellulaceae bacterium]
MDAERCTVIEALCSALVEVEQRAPDERLWPSQQLEQCREYQLYSWFAMPTWGGRGWSESDLMQTYLKLAQVNLTTAFILTQRAAAVDRLQRFGSDSLQERLLPGLTRGELFATVGISHLTTSRQHLLRPALSAEETGRDLVVDGESPWVTGAVHADWLVIGATTANGQHVMAAVPTSSPGLRVHPPLELTALTGSLTGAVSFERVRVPAEQVLIYPQVDGLARRDGGRTGGLPTSALALGHAHRAIDYLRDQSQHRPELVSIAGALDQEYRENVEHLLGLTRGANETDSETLRRRANDLVLRSTYSALAAAKGTGYLASHPTSRWCREALFFLVWSCPQRVVLENLRQWSGGDVSDCPI